MQSRCAKHLFEGAEDRCGKCGLEFCGECLVYAFGPKKPPLCIPCAVAAAGIRAAAGNRPALPKNEMKRFQKERTSAFKRFRRDRKQPAAVDPAPPAVVEPAMPVNPAPVNPAHFDPAQVEPAPLRTTPPAATWPAHPAPVHEPAESQPLTSDPAAYSSDVFGSEEYLTDPAYVDPAPTSIPLSGL